MTNRAIVSDWTSTRQIRNLFTNPKFATLPTNWSTNWWGSAPAAGSIQRGNHGPTGGPAWRKIWNVATTALDIGVKIGLGQDAITPGKTYMFSAWLRASWATTHTIRVTWLDSSGATLPGGLAPPVALGGGRQNPAPNSYARLFIGGVAPAGAASAQIIVGPWPLGNAEQPQNPPVSGSTLDITNVMCTEGAALHPYSDGDTPGWVWEGLAGNSASAGYPYTLESLIGGKPDVQFSGQSFATTSLVASAARTVHFVYNAPGSVPGGAVTGRLGSLSINQNRLRLMGSLSPAGNASVAMIVGLNDAQSEHQSVTKSITGGMTLGKHVVSVAVSEFSRSFHTFSDGLDYGAVALPANIGFRDPKVYAYQTEGVMPITTLVHSGGDTATALAVNQWLTLNP